MKELSLNILDIAMNSVKAGAQHLARELINALSHSVAFVGCD